MIGTVHFVASHITATHAAATHVVAAAKTGESIASDLRGFITPIYLVVVGIVAISLAVSKRTQQLMQFLMLAAVVYALIATNVLSVLGDFASGVLGGSKAGSNSTTTVGSLKALLTGK